MAEGWTPRPRVSELREGGHRHRQTEGYRRTKASKGEMPGGRSLRETETGRERQQEEGAGVGGTEPGVQTRQGRAGAGGRL